MYHIGIWAEKFKIRVQNFLPKLTTFIFDFAGLRVVRILSKVHGTGHVVINPKTEENLKIICHIMNTKMKNDNLMVDNIACNQA